ncbi:hypothetical protein ACOKM5_07925 [Streptomyces sp. BH097]|uniref:hypothetical protein n=1 Tax=unclassified Streptomyces TaxID=2593676 RepID=UPI003BB4AB65
MTYNLLTVEPLDHPAIARALAHALDVSVQDVDVAGEDFDADLRNWEAPVLCDVRSLEGDLALALDIYVQPSIQPQPSEDGLAAAFARTAPATVLFSVDEPRPSAYQLAAQDGPLTRARLLDPEDAADGEDEGYTIDAVEAPVAQLPHVPVTRLPEVVWDAQAAAPSPLKDKLRKNLREADPVAYETAGTPLWLAHTSLAAWEKLVETVRDDWKPAGWYPADLYRTRLEARDTLAAALPQLPSVVQLLIASVLEPLDKHFTAMTVPDDGSLLAYLEQAGGKVPAAPPRWWWQRRPAALPW